MNMKDPHITFTRTWFALSVMSEFRAWSEKEKLQSSISNKIMSDVLSLEHTTRHDNGSYINDKLAKESVDMHFVLDAGI